ncbi:hypothetical protein DFJ73DRAFT_418899 [Zopfochytrium polystomum]|nr:hypothetical protein DFJ73DRAFT_418899 [Zopfochytrium polystomum]
MATASNPGATTAVPVPAANSLAGRQLFVGNLPFTVGWQDLKDLFRDVGTVLRADVATSPAGKSRGFGSVLFATVEEAQNAINTFNNYELNGRKIEVREDRAVSGSGYSGFNRSAAPVHNPDVEGAPVNEPLPGTNIDVSMINVRALYVGNLPYSVGWQDLKDLFRNAGNVIRAEIPTDYQGRSKGFGTVVMNGVEEARKGVSLYNGFEWNGRRLEVREDRTYVEGAPPRSNQNYQAQNNPSSIYQNFHGAIVIGSGIGAAAGSDAPIPTTGRQLFVGNLAFTVQWQELKDLFRQAGTVQRADVAIDAQGRSRGHGQVLMSTVEEAAAAVRLLNGTEVQGRPIEVREDRYAAGAVAAPGVDGGVSSISGTQVFVGNLPYSTRWQELKDIFRPAGLNPIHADVLTEAGTGRSKGCGIVRFTSREEAERAVQLVNGTNVSGRNIVVRLDKFA